MQSCIPNLKSLAQVVFEILRSKRIGVTSLTFQGHVTSSVTCIKFEVSSSSSFKDMFDRIPKIVGSCDLGHAHFQGKLFVRPLGIPDRNLHTKFEVSSSSSFRDIAL